MKKPTKKDLADEAWHRNQQLEIPVGAPTTARPTVVEYAAVPERCPSCDKAMTLASGWALVFGDLLQCGGCSHLVAVPRAEYETYGRALHAHFRQLQFEKPKRESGPRVRGAG